MGRPTGGIEAVVRYFFVVVCDLLFWTQVVQVARY